LEWVVRGLEKGRGVWRRVEGFGEGYRDLEKGRGVWRRVERCGEG